MAKFFVGQKARIIAVRDEKNRYLIGKECRILAPHEWGGVFGWEVDIDGIGPFRSRVDPKGNPYPHWLAEDHLSPIIPDGAKPGNWETLKDLWTPAKLKESV